jgi:hypothetical protein
MQQVSDGIFKDQIIVQSAGYPGIDNENKRHR